MARRRFGGFKRKASRAFKSYRRNVSRSGSNANLMTTAVAAAVYGAVRPKVEQVLNPYTSKLPVVGNYGDEIVLGGLGYMMAKGKLGKNKLIKSAGNAMLVIEAARVGSGLSQGLMPTSNSSSGSNFDNDWN